MNRAEIRENVFKLLFCNEFNEKKDMPKLITKLIHIW